MIRFIFNTIKSIFKAIFGFIALIILIVVVAVTARDCKRNNQMEYHELTRIVKMAETNEKQPNNAIIYCPACGKEIIKKNGYCFCDGNCESRFFDMKLCWEHRTQSMTGAYGKN